MPIFEFRLRLWPLKRSIAAITLYPFIFYNRKHWRYKQEFKTLQRHEWEHVYQVRRDGWFKFYFKWIRETIRGGYYSNPYELEARRNQHKHKDHYH